MPSDDGLDTYRAKRTGGSTPEPMAPTASAGRGPRMFVVHQHDATRMHWDLRLEIDGVLCSWAVPKEPSMDPEDKRLAVKVENHPLEYVHFEAVIPDGNYGAGPDRRRDQVRALRLQAARRVHAGPHRQGQARPQLGARLQRLAPDQEARRAGRGVPRGGPATAHRERAIGADDRR